MNTRSAGIGFWDLIVQAAYSMRDNRLRTCLSMLGIAVGVAAVIAVSAVSSGGREMVFQELQTFGLKSVWVFRNFEDKDPHRLVRPGTGIDNQDFKHLRLHCCSSLKRLSPVVEQSDGWIVQQGSRYGNPEIIGVDSDYLAINNERLTVGRSFRVQDIRGRRAVALLAPTAARDLFGAQANIVGRSFRIKGRKFTVIGMLKSKSRSFLSSIGSSGGEDANNRILIPYTIAQQLNGHNSIFYLQGEALAITQAEQAAKQIMASLTRRNGGNYSYNKITMASYIDNFEKILRGVALIGVVAASVSLLVGGIGIVSVMSTAVLERTREIGLRKALGASQHDILFQFLIEAVLMSTFGGLIGLVLGISANEVLEQLSGFTLIPSHQASVLGLGAAMTVGILAGFYPARRAARLHPVEALRYE